MPFLTARWTDLVLLNYSCPADLFGPLVPKGTELDAWHGEALISLVGFLFSDTRLLGLPIPFHTTFEEVNLRFYVRRIAPNGELRRAVVFVRELVPRQAIATLARWVYNEPYLSVPMQHRSTLDIHVGGDVSYGWRYRGAPFEMTAAVEGAAQLSAPESEAEFITEHYWGYTRQRDGSTLEYQVEHPTWRVWDATRAAISGPLETLYGSAFGKVLSGVPRSAFVAVGSEIAVHHGMPLSDQR